MNQSAKCLWDECREIIRKNILPEQYNALFAFAEFKDFNDDLLVLTVPSHFIYETLERDEYINLISATLKRVFKRPIRLAYSIPVVNKVKDAGVSIASSNQSNVADVKTSSRAANKTPDELTAPTVRELDSQLHKGYSFENYIEGESNRLARSVGEAIANKPAHAFNPLFVFGPSGCGKTHLVTAIGWRVKQLHPELRVLYLSAHLFTVQYTDAVKQNKVNDFIRFYQTIDVLIIDDAQEFAGKTQTQNTFFHIFNHLHLNKKQLILTADRSPAMMEGFEDRLLSRFKWGMNAEIQKPAKELRYLILKNIIRQEGLKINDAVINYIAETIDESVRDLEGILTTLMAYSVALNCDITVALVKKLMPRFKKEFQPKKNTVDDIKRCVSDYFKISQDVICSKSRKQEIVYVRQILIYMLSRFTDESTVQIGRQIGGRNHATVIHSINQMKNMIELDEKVRNDIRELESFL